jgi:hypothetical protein
MSQSNIGILRSLKNLFRYSKGKVGVEVGGLLPMDKILPSIARGLAARGSGRGDSEMWRRDEDWSGEVKLGTSTRCC